MSEGSAGYVDLHAAGLPGSTTASMTWTDGQLWDAPFLIAMILRVVHAYAGKPLHRAGGP